MKRINILKAAGAALATLAILSSCVGEPFQEVTEISLSRCLSPQNLSARVDVATGDNVIFDWDVNKDADSYSLVISTVQVDENKAIVPGSEVVAETVTVQPSEVPYSIRLTADNNYTFKVQALSESRDASAWSEFGDAVKTYAVKDNLFPEITARTANSVSLQWSKDASDYKEVTVLSARPVKGGETVEYTIKDAEKTAAAATISGLAASTEYQITLFYMSASRGAVDAWTMAAPGTMTSVSTSEALVANVTAGGEIYLTLAGSPYTLGGSKPTGSVHIVGELGADGSKPVVTGNFDISSICASGMDIICENILFDDQETHNHVVNYSGGVTTIGTIKFVNCGFTHYKAGLFYNNKTGDTDVLTVGDIIFDTCDMFEVATAPGGDCIDFRKGTHSTLKSIQIVNCTIYDGIRTLFRLGDQAGEALTITDGMKIENNTIKNIVYIDNTNNRGIFAIRVPVTMSLKKNLFLYVDGGKTADGVEDYAQLFQNKGETVVPTLNASDNYAFACGKDFFTKVDAATAGFKVLTADPCYNSKGNFFQLANQDLISAKVGASKWWIPYAEKEEDLTQNVLAGAHVWNLQDASLFAGEVKNSRVRDELLLVGTEATPLNADGGINFLGASALTRKGVPTEGYISFIVDTPGSVDLEVANGGASSLAVGVQSSNGFEVIGAVAASGQGVQKVLLPDISGESVVFIYSTGAISLKKLAWSLDAVGGNRLLATPAPAVEPVTLTEGDATAVTVSWAAVAHAASYKVVFKGQSYDQTETSFIIAEGDVAALKAGLYTVTVQAIPVEGDIYYEKSEKGSASFAVQPKGGDVMEEHTMICDFSSAGWQEYFATLGASGTDLTPAAGWNHTEDGFTFTATQKNRYTATALQIAGAGSKTERVITFDAPAGGTLKVTSSNTGNSAASPARNVLVALGDGEGVAKSGGSAATEPTTNEWEISGAGKVYVYTDAALRIYKLEFTYVTGGAPAAVDYVWNFADAPWQEYFATLGASGTDLTPAAGWNITVDGLTFYSIQKNRYTATALQIAGAGSKTERVFTFNAPVAGTVSVASSNTGNSEANPARNVLVAVDEGDGVAKSGGSPSGSAPTVNEWEVSAGKVYIYTDAALRIYSVEFHSN